MSDPLPYDREVLVTVLVHHHWSTNTKPCSCGWFKLGASWPEHVADVYEQRCSGSAGGPLEPEQHGDATPAVDAAEGSPASDDDTLREALASAIGGRLVLRPSMTEVADDVLAVLREKGVLR